MPAPGKTWYHLTLGTHASWLPGDPRGFRDRRHRVHSSGDHQNPPPPGEHRNLHGYNKQHSSRTTLIPTNLRGMVGQKIVDHLIKLKHRVLALSVGGMYSHILAELPADRGQAKHEMTRCKQAATLAVRELLPNKLWAKGLGIKPIRDRQHQLNTYSYIRKHARQGAWVWTHRDGVVGTQEQEPAAASQPTA
jgi:hypothetical protein